ncbi:TIGR03862 family flavoprotein [Spongiibacter thalassae]
MTLHGKTAQIIGGGPAGLMAAEQLAGAGVKVAVYDAMPSLGRKFLRAGIGGLNITHSEDQQRFLSRFGERQGELEPLLARFDSAALQQWCETLGVTTFVGSSGRVFPLEKKAAPLLRRWLARLRATNVSFYPRHRMVGWNDNGDCVFDHRGQQIATRADVTVFATGGSSWSALGSDGQWLSLFERRAIACAPFKPSNCGFNYSWPEPLMAEHYGRPLKNIGLSVEGDGEHRQREVKQGDALISHYGIEGSLVYTVSAAIRDQIDAGGAATVYWDLLPGSSSEKINAVFSGRKAGESVSNTLRKLGIKGAKAALLKSLSSKAQMQDTASLAALLKRLPQTLTSYRPIDEAISTAGGVCFSAVDDHLMIRSAPGYFCAGEMLDWEAPTGGYLLTACYATGYVAGCGAVAYLTDSAAAKGRA